MGRAAVVLALIASLFLLAACCGKEPTPLPSSPSGVRGIVLYAGGPVSSVTSPSPLPGGFGSIEQGGLYRWVTVKVAEGTARGSVVARVKPNANAIFTVDLPPGTYVLTPVPSGNSPPQPPVTVVVKSGRFTRAYLYVHVP